jgi:Spy/CpxP family protein refolding chaperone
MSTNINPLASSVSRRQFINTAALATAGAALASRSTFAQTAPSAPAASTPNAIAASNYAKALVEAYGRPNSKFNGVQVGTITYSFRSMPSSAEELLKYCVISGISAIEMMGAPADQYLSGATGGGGRGGLPNATPAQTDAYAAMTAAITPLSNALQTARTNLAAASLRNAPNSDAIRAATEEVSKADAALAQARMEQLAKIQNSANKLNAEQLAVVQQANGVPAPGRGGGGRGGAGGAPAAMPAWMTPANLTKLADLRRMYNEAGVTIYALKNIGGNQSDAELDYRLQMAKVLGATHDTLELSEDPKVLERLGAFGVKHGIRIGYHTHLQGRLDAFDEALKLSPANSLNVDCGHFWAANGSSAIPLLKRFPERVASIHLKDRTGPNNGQQNLMWGTGETDIIDILRTMRDEKWTFPASAELEYTVPQGSNAVVEVGRCRAYAGMALMT